MVKKFKNHRKTISRVLWPLNMALFSYSLISFFTPYNIQNYFELKNYCSDCSVTEYNVSSLNKNYERFSDSYPMFSKKEFFKMKEETIKAKTLRDSCLSIGDTIGARSIHILDLYDFDKFVDTEKPNAAVAIPFDDKWGTYSILEQYAFFKSLEKVYDLNLKIISNVNELNHLVDETPKPELLIIAGHGDGRNIYFSNNSYNSNYNSNSLSSNFNSIKWTKNYFEKDSTRLIGHNIDFINNLEDDAHILLFSCEAAKYDLANLVKCYAGEKRTVLASKESFAAREIKVKQFYPLDLKFIVGGKDVTYKR